MQEDLNQLRPGVRDTSCLSDRRSYCLHGDRASEIERDWTIRAQRFELSETQEHETIFSIGNGYAGIRGACNLPIPGAQPDLFLAGVYDAKAENLPYSEVDFMTTADRDEPHSELVSFPFPFHLRLVVGGRELSVTQSTLVDYERELDLKRALMFEKFEFQDEFGRKTRLQTLRCASLNDPHLLLHEIEITCLNHSEVVEVDTSLESPDVTSRHPHLIVLHNDVNGRNEHNRLLSDLHIYQTRSSATRVCIAVRSALGHDELHDQKIRVQPEQGKPIVIQRLISIFTSRDVSDPVASAQAHLLSKNWGCFLDYITAHMNAWKDFWHGTDVQILGNPSATETLRFNSYHLRIAAPDDPRASIGARTLSGRAYEGHIFWDVEIFILPFSIYTRPEIARNLLLYRHSTLGGARARAAAMGYEGACYAWESTASGQDATPKLISLKGTDTHIPIFTGSQQIHVTAGVAYGVIHYWEATEDAAFMREYGTEILSETARFWTSRAVDGSDGKLHILSVVGPDEYHHSVNDNAYTNCMARNNLAGAVRAAEWLRATDRPAWEALSERLSLRPDEVLRWKDAAKRLFIPQPNRQGVVPQFEGFFDLKDVCLTAEERLRAPTKRLSRWEEVNASKVIKQADVLMIPFLFHRAWNTDVIRANYHYYEPITDHGSSLSPSIHSAIAARIGEKEAMRRYWKTSLLLDRSNLMKNTGLGFHAACAGGTWQALVFHILGLGTMLTGTGPDDLPPSLGPVLLPIEGDGVCLNLRHRGQMTPYFIPAIDT